MRFDGRHVLIGDDVCRVIRQHPELPCMVIEHPDGYQIEMPFEEFRMAKAHGQVSAGLDAEFGTTFIQADHKLDHEFRKTVVKKIALLRQDGHSWKSARALCEKDVMADPRFEAFARQFPSVRTLQTWRATYIRKGSSSLRDSRDASGNRTMRHSGIFEDIVLDMLDETFLTSDRMTVTQLTRSAGYRYREVCRGNGIEPRDHGRKVVETIVDSLPHSDVVKMRLGSELARKKLLQAGRFQSIQHPLDRVEVDSTLADIFVIVDDDGTLARPWVTMAIDAASGVVLGMTISLDNPTSLTTVKTLIEAMTPKENAFFDEYGIHNRLQAFGGLLTVVADQGSENSGDLIRRLIQVSGLEFQKATPKHPEKKPFVERLMSTFRVFVTQLPGATKTDEIPAQSRTTTAKDEARLTLEQFVASAQRWRYDVYGQTPRRRVATPLKKAESPTACWRRMLELAFIPEPPTAQELNMVLFSRRETRKLQHYGIEVNRIQYWSAELGDYFRAYKNREVVIWTNPVDIRESAVIAPEAGEPIFVRAKDPDMPALTVEELKRILKAARPAAGDFMSAQQALDAIVGGHNHRATTASGAMSKKKDNARQKRRKKEIAASGANASVVHEVTSFVETAELPLTLPETVIKISKKAG